MDLFFLYYTSCIKGTMKIINNKAKVHSSAEEDRVIISQTF